MPFFMRIGSFCGILLLTGSVAVAADEKPAAATGKVPEDNALAQQMRAIAQMEASLETQRETVRKQVPPRAAGQSFFLSAPPKPGPPLAADALSAATAPACDPLPTTEVDSLVGEAAKREDLDPALLRGVMEQESAFRPCALSPKGAMGLMQLMPATATQFGVHDPFDAGQSVDAGARFLKQLLQNYGGDVPKALGAYNAGPAKVNEVNGIPPIPETVEYIRRVMMLLPALQ
ncbi:MAG TPA: lytic transglycosylase domain-containing protein [Bryobacteraceae bacterium]|jgi:soluble lytic murein transglycosylase-like protein|nr:lytic transglycosylase domain-containing protein [Bryobacteraceae bacterium]